MSEKTKPQVTAADDDYSMEAVPESARKGFRSMFFVMLGFTFFSASMKRLRSHPIPGQPRSLHFYMYIYLTCSSMSVTTGFRINPSTHSAQNP